MKPHKTRVAPLQGRLKSNPDGIRTVLTTKGAITVKVINGITHIRSRLDDGPRWIPVRVLTKRK